MTFVDQITVLVLTYNEEANIERTLEAIKWAKHILVVDSGSNDATLKIVGKYPQLSVATRKFDTFAAQCNFGLSEIKTDWVLSIDADYEVSEALASEIQMLSPRKEDSGFRASFIYRVHGQRLRSTLYPPRTVLYRRDRARYHDEGHGHRVAVDGKVRNLAGPIYHDDRKPLARWFASQRRYAELEADYLLSEPATNLGRNDRLRRMGWLAPILVFFYTLIWKGCILDGWPGWLYVMQRTLSELMFAIEITDRYLRQVENEKPL